MDDTANNSALAPELAEAAREQAPADTEQPESDQSSYDGADLDTDGADPEFEEVEIDGEKLAVPKPAAEKLKAAMLRQADYTRKTQELAEARKQSEMSYAERMSRVEAEQADVQAVARMVNIQDRLQAYASVNWASLDPSDPAVQKARWEYEDLSRQAQAANAAISQRIQQRALEQQHQAQQAEAELARTIPGWKSDNWKDLRKVAEALGATPESMRPVQYAPWVARALHSHKTLMEMQAKAAKAPAAPPAAPVKTVTGVRATAAKDPDKMSIDEWMQVERKRLAKMGRRY